MAAFMLLGVFARAQDNTITIGGSSAFSQDVPTACNLIKSAEATSEVDLTGLAAGAYLLRVTTDNGVTTRHVLLK